MFFTSYFFPVLVKNPRKILLIDGLGALLSSLLLLVVASFETVFGMPKQVFYLLIPLAIIFTINSLTCYYLKVSNWRILYVIATANLSYCLLTLVLVFYHWQGMTWLGIWYFFSELAIVLLISSLEIKLANHMRNSMTG
jgi:hypothetical protein